MTNIRSLYAELPNTAIVHRTPCGSGHMLWREWGQGEPLVLLHGGSGSWRHWIANIPYLCQHFRLLVADLPGLGDSDMPPDGFDHGDLITATQKLARIVLDGIEQLTDEPVRLVGFSAGSITAAQLCARYPHAVQSLHLAGASSLGLPWGGLTGKLQAMRRDMSRDQKLAVQGHNAGVIMLSKPAAADSIEAELQLDNTDRARLRTHPLADGGVLKDALPHIQCPTHAIWGEQDPYALPDLAGRITLLQHYFPNGDFHSLADAGHWVMYERADAFNPALLKQLQQT